jgi:uncharacterized lipoprotein NlpE involved in copper resistance
MSWGQGTSNNDIGWGQGSVNDDGIGWGEIYADSWSGDTDIIGFDSDALAYFTSYSITDATEKGAVNTLVNGLKDNSLWAKGISLHTISPTSLAASQGNLINPGTFDLTWNNSPTHGAGGVLLNGSTQFAQMGIIPGTHLTINDVTIWARIVTASTTIVVLMGANQSTSQRLQIIPRSGDTFLFDCYGTADGRISAANTSTTARYLATRRASNDFESYKDGVSQVSATGSNGSQPSIEMYLGAQNNSGSAANHVTGTITDAGVFTGLTDAEVTILDGLLTTYNTTLGR